MKLIAITLPHFFDGESSEINRLFEAGLGCLHLRKPGADISDLQALLNDIEERFLDRIAIHYQNKALVETYDIERIHFPEMARSEVAMETLLRIKEQGKILSTSIHQPEQIAHLGAVFDYAFLSPVFDSISKPGYKSAIPGDFNLLSLKRTTEIIALGGVTIHKINILKQMGFDGLAILGALWNKAEPPSETFNRFKKALHEQA